ncbi:MAG TPA: DUF4253 domain-containing protein [Gemmatimonadaceae bacterium]|nr:DUF4253 domain-containing protein [Gemmatimonadaceae bacterium]
MGRFLRSLLSVAAFFAIWTFMRHGCFAQTEDVDGIHAENARHARERAEAIPNDFVVPDSFPELLAALERLTGSAPVPFVGERDWYASIELVATTGNPSPSSKEIASWFRELEREQPFTITDIGRDHVGGRFVGALKDPRALARRFNDFCPDIVRQGTGSVRNLEIELRESQYLYCWWD